MTTHDLPRHRSSRCALTPGLAIATCLWVLAACGDSGNTSTSGSDGASETETETATATESSSGTTAGSTSASSSGTASSTSATGSTTGSTSDGSASSTTTSSTTDDPTTSTTDDPTTSTTDDPTTSTTDNLTSDAMTTGEPSECGDGVVEGDEQCDDGNDDETDACTSLCAPPSCDDGLHSGDETDVDCGGSCDGCDVGQFCDFNDDCAGQYCTNGECSLTNSCFMLLQAVPELKNMDGWYPIDPDGNGGVDPFDVYCDMTTDGGGWTRVLIEDFEDPPTEWSNNSTSTCGNLGTFLGGYNLFGGNMFVNRDVDLLGVPHSQARLVADYKAVDSWDDEKAFARVDGAELWSNHCNYNNDECGQQSNGDQCGGNWEDGSIHLDAKTQHFGNTAQIGFGSNLDQDPDDESFGFDNVELYVI